MVGVAWAVVGAADSAMQVAAATAAGQKVRTPRALAGRVAIPVTIPALGVGEAGPGETAAAWVMVQVEHKQGAEGYSGRSW